MKIDLELLNYYEKVEQAPQELYNNVDDMFDIFLEKQKINPSDTQLNIQKQLKKKHIKIYREEYPSKFLEEFIIKKHNKVICKIQIDFNKMEAKTVYYE